MEVSASQSGADVGLWLQPPGAQSAAGLRDRSSKKPGTDLKWTFDREVARGHAGCGNDRVNDKGWLDGAGHSRTQKLRVVEEFRRPDFGHLEIQTTIDDPGAYARPWTIKQIADLAPNEEIQEFICSENNQDLEHLTGK